MSSPCRSQGGKFLSVFYSSGLLPTALVNLLLFQVKYIDS